MSEISDVRNYKIELFPFVCMFFAIFFKMRTFIFKIW